jgi:hypothetical protein
MGDERRVTEVWPAVLCQLIHGWWVESNRSVTSCAQPADPLVMSGEALMLLSTHHKWISWQSTAGHTSVTLHSSPVDQLAEHSWSHFCYSPLITRGTACWAQLVTLLLLSTHNPWNNWQSTSGNRGYMFNNWIVLCLSAIDVAKLILIVRLIYVVDKRNKV